MMVFALAGTASAQGIDGGAKVGVNFSSVSGDIEADKNLRSALVIGGFVTVPMVPALAFQPEVLYSMQGVKAEEFGEEATIEIDEVQIPLLLRIGGDAGHVLVGPSIGFITRAKLKADNFEQDFKDDLKSTDIGIVFGAGFGISHLLVEARYTHGMTNLNDDDSSDDNKSRVFSVLVGVRF